MRAKASFKGHAIHQMLVPFPLAFLVGAFAFDVAGVLLDRPPLWTTGGYLALAGIAAALLAATPGLVDFIGAVPPKSTGKSRALKHGSSNVAATLLFGVAWLTRSGTSVEPGWTTLGLEAVGVILLTMGSWMGGTLVARNQIGIDHRYARAGKWKERKVTADGAGSNRPLDVAGLDELQVDQMMLVHVGARRIVLGRTEDGFVAFDDRCTHRGASLADGVLICGTVQCPWHGSQFNVRSGKRKAGPAEEGIRSYKVEESGGRVRIVI